MLVGVGFLPSMVSPTKHIQIHLFCKQKSPCNLRISDIEMSLTSMDVSVTLKGQLGVPLVFSLCSLGILEGYNPYPYPRNIGRFYRDFP